MNNWPYREENIMLTHIFQQLNLGTLEVTHFGDSMSKLRTLRKMLHNEGIIPATDWKYMQSIHKSLL